MTYMIELVKYKNEKNELCNLIKKFWIAHNDYTSTDEEALEDLISWTGENHVVYFIRKEENIIGFVHLASRGVRVDWLEDLFILPEYQGNGYGTGLISFARDYAKTIDCYKMYLITNRSNISACKCYEKAGGINKVDDEIIYVYDFKEKN